MKTRFKRLIAAVSSAVLCAVPMMNSLPASAAGSLNTYRIYYDVPANSGVYRIYSVLDFNNMTVKGTTIGNIGGEITTAQINTPDYTEYGIFYQASGPLTTTGTAFTVKITTASTFNASIVNFNTNAANSSLDIMSNNPVTTDIVLVGDANDDGVVDILDVTKINSYIVNSETHPLDNLRAADANGDGIVTNDDSSMIMEYIVKLIPNF